MLSARQPADSQYIDQKLGLLDLIKGNKLEDAFKLMSLDSRLIDAETMRFIVQQKKYSLITRLIDEQKIDVNDIYQDEKSQKAWRLLDCLKENQCPNVALYLETAYKAVSISDTKIKKKVTFAEQAVQSSPPILMSQAAPSTPVPQLRDPKHPWAIRNMFVAAERNKWKEVFAYLDRGLSPTAVHPCHLDRWTLLKYAEFHDNKDAYLELQKRMDAEAHQASREFLLDAYKDEAAEPLPRKRPIGRNNP
jgi:hypothetical protein